MSRTLFTAIAILAALATGVSIPEDSQTRPSDLCDEAAHADLSREDFADARRGFRLGLDGAKTTGDHTRQKTCYFYLGLVSHIEGRRASDEERRRLFDDAFGRYERALELDPTNVRVLNNLAQLAAEIEDWTRAVKLFESALDRASDDQWTKIAHNFANLLAKRDQWQRASELYLDILEINSFDDYARQQLVELYLARDPPALVPHIVSLTESGLAAKALEISLSLLKRGEPAGELREDLLVMAVFALAEKRYSVEEFARQPARTILSKLVRDPTIGRGAMEILKLHRDPDPMIGSYVWWSSSTEEAVGTPAVLDRIEAFRSLLRALSRKVLLQDRQRARSYIELAMSLPARVPDVKSYTMLAQHLAIGGEKGTLKEKLRHWRRELELVPGNGSLAGDLVEYHIVVANISREFGWQGNRLWPYTMEYHLERARVTSLSKPNLMEDVARAYEQNGLLDEAIVQYRQAARFFRGEGQGEKGQELFAIAEQLQRENPDIRRRTGSGGGGGGKRIATTTFTEFGCEGAPWDCVILNTAQHKGDASFLLLASEAVERFKTLTGSSTICSATLNLDLLLLHGARALPRGDTLAEAARGFIFGNRFGLASSTSIQEPQPMTALFALPRITGLKLTLNPRWTYDGAWSREGSELFLVDAVRRQILVYHAQEGRFRGAWAWHADGTGILRSPASMETTSDGVLVVEEGEGRWIWLDVEGQPLREVALLAESRSASGALGGIFAWTLVGEEMLAFGDIELADGSWESGFVRVPLASPAEFELLHPTALDSPARLFYRYGQNFVARVGAKGYFLAMENPPAIYEMSPADATDRAPRRLRSFPGPHEELAVLPRLPQAGGIGAAQRIAEAMERSTGVVGIFGGRRFLQVLARFVAPDTGTVSWSLLQIDPQRDQLLGGFTLPTSAPHLLVVPGPQYWAFVEKGRVRDLGEQDVDSLLLIPTAWVEDPRSAPGSLRMGTPYWQADATPAAVRNRELAFVPAPAPISPVRHTRHPGQTR